MNDPDLAAYLSGHLDAEQSCDFLRRVTSAVSAWQQTSYEAPSARQERDKLAKIEASAQALGAAVQEMDEGAIESMAPHFDYLMGGADPPVSLTAATREGRLEFDEWLAEQVDRITELQAAFAHFTARIATDNSSPARKQRQFLVRMLAHAYWDVTDKPPPKSDWFYAFVAEVGKTIGAPLGKDLVKAVLSDLQ